MEYKINLYETCGLVYSLRRWFRGVLIYAKPLHTWQGLNLEEGVWIAKEAGQNHISVKRLQNPITQKLLGGNPSTPGCWTRTEVRKNVSRSSIDNFCAWCFFCKKLLIRNSGAQIYNSTARVYGLAIKQKVVQDALRIDYQFKTKSIIPLGSVIPQKWKRYLLQSNSNA